MTDKIRILYIDDYQLDRELVKDALEKEHGGFEVKEASNKHEFEALLKNHEFDVVLSDFNIAGFEGFQVIEVVHALYPDMPVIIVTGTGSEEIAVMALKQGASDYVIKRPSHIKKLPQTILAVIENKSLRDQHRKNQSALIESGKKYRMLFENMAQGVFYQRADGIVIDCNQSALDMMGLTRKQFIGKTSVDTQWKIIHEDGSDFPGEQHPSMEALRTGKPVRNVIAGVFNQRLESYVWLGINAIPEYKTGENKPFQVFVTLHDITGRKLAEDRLREGQEMFRGAFENAPVGMCMVNPDGRFLSVNSSLCSMFGYSENELISKTFRDITHPDDLDTSNKWVRSLLAGETTVLDMEKRYLHKTGHVVWGIVRSFLLRNNDGSPHLFITHILDITKRKRVEEELRESEDKFKHIFEYSSVGKSITFPSGEMQPNLAFYTMLGYSQDESRNLKWYDITYPDDVEYSKKVVDLLLSGKKDSERFFKRYLHKNGSIVWADVSTTLRRDKDGRPLYLISTMSDITRQKKAEEALHIEQERFSKAFHASPNPTTISRMTDGTIIEVNDTWVEVFGYSRAESVGKTSISLGIWGDPENRRKAIQKLQETGSLRNYETDLWRKTGEARHVLLSIEPFKIEGEQILIAIVQDITERKKMEEELLKSRKLESIGVLAGGIAHDFNNILTTIMGNITLARMQVKSDNEIYELLTEAEAASARAQKLTGQLLTFSKGGAPLKEIASIKDIIKESSSFVLRGSKSDCEFSIAKDLWSAEVDPGQISQVINNIVINANQAMPEGGIIQIAAENLIIDDSCGLPLTPGGYIRISIKDQGVGISEKHFLSIFDPYFTTKQQGSGLGLATSYSIIKKHDGHITLESRIGAGTAFFIYLPASEKSVPEKEETQLITGYGRILVMDDEAPLRKMVGRMLKPLGYESEFANNGSEAVNMYKEAKEAGKPYDAVILDLTIPGGMGGKEAIKKLLEIDPDIKAIVSSGYSNDPVLANFLEYGFKGIMPKPFETQSLSKVLHEVLKVGNATG